MRYELGLPRRQPLVLWEALSEAIEAAGFEEVFTFSDPQSDTKVAQFRRGDDIASLSLSVRASETRISLDSDTVDLRQVAVAAAQKMVISLLADLLVPLVDDEVVLKKRLEALVQQLFDQLEL